MAHYVGFVPLSQVKAHMRAVKARTREVFGEGERAKLMQQNADEICSALDENEANKRLNAIVNAPDYATALALARDLLDVYSRAAQGKTACKKGCSACCYIPVAIPSSEAKIIASAINKPLSVPAHHRSLSIHHLINIPDAKDQIEARNHRAHNGTPCPFLIEGSCSIYEHRPIACRQQMSMDVDDLLCRLVKGQIIHVPYLNMQNVERALALHVHAHYEAHTSESISDIRDWFKG